MQQRRTLAGASAKPGRAAMFTAILSAILIASLVAVHAASGGRILPVQSLGAGAPEVYTAEKTLADGANITVNDAAVRTQGGEEDEVRRVVKEFTNDREFSMIGLTWTGDRDIVAFVRAQQPDGSWGEWYEMDQATPPTGATTFGTEPIFVGSTKRIQVSTGNVDLLDRARTDSNAPTTAKDIEAVFLDGGTGTVDGGIAPVADSYTSGMPKVITRAQWGASSSKSPYYSEPTTAATVHHTAGSNNYTEAQAPGIVRGIWQYHARDLGWGDIGYHALVDKYGNIYEGRAGGMDRGPQGAHVGAFNQNTWGVSMLGNYEVARPSQAALQAMGDIIGWKAAVAGFDPMGSSYHYAEGNFNGSRFAAGQGKMFPNINAHRDFHFNDCPGDYLYAQMGTIRTIANTKYKSLGGRSGLSAAANAAQNATNAVDAVTDIAGAVGDLSSLSSNTETTVNPDGTVTTVVKGNGSSGDGSAADAVGSARDALTKLSSGDPVAIAAVAGTAVGALLLFLASQNIMPQMQNLAGVDLMAGLNLQQAADIARKVSPSVGPALKAFGANDAAAVWYKFEPTLGKLVAGVGGPTGPAVALYSGGVAVRDSNGEIYELVGKIAEAWLQQGLDVGPLGMPITRRYYPTKDEVRVDFEGGSIVYNPVNNAVNINVK
ncbi:N-acetylmuramoyl-L-alanine amidase [Corynebacterium sp. Marseille-P4321]|uniref:N-acetylmuramoyl-L-alanine amidase n=1 Tax=Corynebacterium sp. Marseille-P4321 TaxID=2736603 RepID=UPI0020CA6908|nr:N-acetylmuramoyl-L-alanine amidase [Corynebacterium sp. Marseille-P4321]